MIISRFLLWARHSPPGDRAEAVSALARAYLYSELSREDRQEAEQALTAMLDDGSELVRLAMAEALGASPDAPRHIILALADDGPDIARIVLARSPLLADCDLVDCAALGDEPLQIVIAARREVSSPVSAALAEIGTAETLVTLARNPGADVADFSIARMLERHGSSGRLREALLVRPDLPVEFAHAIAAALAESLGSFVTGCGWLSPERSGRVVREARERTTVALSARSASQDNARLVAHLRRSGQLTPALVLRAILSGARPFADSAFADLTGIATNRVAAILSSSRGGSFRALYMRAGLPEMLRPAFEAALFASQQMRERSPDRAALSRRLIERALAACDHLPGGEAGRLRALLHRFEVEAARDEARIAAGELADRAAASMAAERSPSLESQQAQARRLAA